MTAYRAGYLFERKVHADLAKDGYYVAESRGSHGVADLVALKYGQVLLVQCKGGAKGLSLREWNDLCLTAYRVGAVPLIASRSKRGVIAYTRITGVAEARRARPGEPWTADELRIAPVQRVEAALCVCGHPGIKHDNGHTPDTDFCWGTFAADCPCTEFEVTR